MAPNVAQVPEELKRKESENAFILMVFRNTWKRENEEFIDITHYTWCIKCLQIKQVFRKSCHVHLKQHECFSGNRNLFLENCLHQVASRVYVSNRGGSCPVFFEKWNYPLTSCFTLDVDQRLPHLQSGECFTRFYFRNEGNGVYQQRAAGRVFKP